MADRPRDFLLKSEENAEVGDDGCPVIGGTALAPTAREGVTTHYLKTWPAFWLDIAHGRKTFEVRRDDRPSMFREGDTLVLQEWGEHTGYSGRDLTRTVSYVLPGGQLGIEEGYVVMGIR